jgi:hypothetical protein
VSFPALVDLRWTEACAFVGLHPHHFRFSWDYGDDYDHFKKKRGFAVCFMYPEDGSAHLLFSTKMFRAPLHRQDAIVRHEIGHALDWFFENHLDRLAYQHGKSLPGTPERRADAIAELIWGEPLLYDKDLVQSTRYGVTPRPRHLGL